MFIIYLYTVHIYNFVNVIDGGIVEKHIISIFHVLLTFQMRIILRERKYRKSKIKKSLYVHVGQCISGKGSHNLLVRP